MIKLCRAAGVRAPDFRQDGGQFVQTLWRPKPNATAQVTAQVGTESNVFKDKVLQELAETLGTPAAQVTAQVTAQVIKVLDAAASEAKNREDLQSVADIAHREHFRKFYVEPMVESGWLERTIPDKPTSRFQKYRLTAKGHAWLANAKTAGKRPS